MRMASQTIETRVTPQGTWSFYRNDFAPGLGQLVVSVIDLSSASYRKMKQNLWWAAGYNLVAVPLAAGVLAPVGFVMPMSVGAILMSVSTIVVALNAQLLRRLDLRPR